MFLIQHSSSRPILLLVCPMMRHSATFPHLSRPLCIIALMLEVWRVLGSEFFCYCYLKKNTLPHLENTVCSCFLCKVHHTSCLLSFKHLKFHHGLYPGKSLCLNCGEPGCSIIFCTYSGYKQHLSRAHWGYSIYTDVISNFELEPVANVGAEVILRALPTSLQTISTSVWKGGVPS